jgi:hypothetical protein
MVHDNRHNTRREVQADRYTGSSPPETLYRRPQKLSTGEPYCARGCSHELATTKPPSGHRNTASVDSYAADASAYDTKVAFGSHTTDASTYDTKFAVDNYVTGTSAYERYADATEASRAAPGHDIPGAEGSVIKEASYDQ